jgi:hypothetical protein
MHGGVTVNSRKPLSRAAKVVVFGLLGATLGVLIQILSGVDFPTIPPVLFILLIPALLIVVAPWRWAPVLAVLAGLFLTVGLFLSSESDRLFDWGEAGGATGLWVQTVSVAIAGVAGAIAVTGNYRSGQRGRR